MKLIITIFLSAILAINQKPGNSFQQQNQKLVGVFDGRTPCQDLAAQLQETVSTECIKIKWRLTLYQDSVSGNPTTYSLVGFTHQRGNPQTGNWKITKGTFTDKDATVYELEQSGRAPLFFQKLDDNILYFLNKDRKLLVGNRDFSHTLNRNDQKSNDQ